MDTLRQTGIQLLLCVAVAFMPLSFVHAQRQPGTTVNIAVTPTFNVGALLLAQDKGIFKKHGLDVTIHFAPDAGAVVKGVTTQKYDIGYANTISALQAIDTKHPIMLLHPAYAYPIEADEDPQQLYLAPNSNIQSLQDLANATIGTPYLRNVAEWSIRKILDNLGIADHSQVRWHQVNPDMAHVAVSDGTVDAVWLKQPDGGKAREAGLLPAFSMSTNALPGATGGYYFTSKKFSVKYWDLLRKFQTAMTEANYYATQYPSHNRETLVKYLQVDQQLVNATYLNRHSNDPGLTHLNTIINDAVRYGLIKKAPDISQLFWKK